MPETIAYEITVAGRVDHAWDDWLETPCRVSLADDQSVTRLTYQFKDQAGLIGLLRQMHALGVELLSVVRSGCAAI